MAVLVSSKNTFNDLSKKINKKGVIALVDEELIKKIKVAEVRLMYAQKEFSSLKNKLKIIAGSILTLGGYAVYAKIKNAKIKKGLDALTRIIEHEGKESYFDTRDDLKVLMAASKKHGITPKHTDADMAIIFEDPKVKQILKKHMPEIQVAVDQFEENKKDRNIQSNL